MKDCFEKEFTMRYFEMNKHGMASPTTMLTLLEETAAEHCHAIDYNLYTLERQNIGWVLISGIMQMDRYPRYKENIRIQTWISRFTLVKGYRENLILDNDGYVIGRAKGIWAFYDIAKRKPAPVYKAIKEKWGVFPEESVCIGTDKIGPIQNNSPVKEFDVYRSDVDSNKHVNNIRYFHWLLESLPEGISDHYLLHTISARFFTEARYGEQIQVYQAHGEDNHTFLHDMRSSMDNRLFVSAHTKWKNLKE